MFTNYLFYLRSHAISFFLILFWKPCNKLRESTFVNILFRKKKKIKGELVFVVDLSEETSGLFHYYFLSSKFGKFVRNVVVDSSPMGEIFLRSGMKPLQNDNTIKLKYFSLVFV